MLKQMITVLLCTACSAAMAQSSRPKPAVIVPVTKITGNGYTLSTPFTVFEKNDEQYYALAFGTRTENGLKMNVVLLEHAMLKYSADMYDSTSTWLDMKIGTSRKTATRTWSDDDHLRLKRSALQPSSDSKGFVLSYDLPDSIVADMRNKELWEIFTRDSDSPVFGYGGGRQHRVDGAAGKIFITYAAKIPGGKSVYDNPAPFLKNKIPLWSLFHQTKEVINSKLGAPVLDTNRNGNIYYRHLTPHGVYEVLYKNDISITVDLIPSYRFFRTEDYLTPANTPFEVPPLQGADYTTENTPSTIDYTYKDRKRVRVHVGRGRRWINEVSVEDY